MGDIAVVVGAVGIYVIAPPDVAGYVDDGNPAVGDVAEEVLVVQVGIVGPVRLEVDHAVVAQGRRRVAGVVALGDSIVAVPGEVVGAISLL